jgi:hypothetical protein
MTTQSGCQPERFENHQFRSDWSRKVTGGSKDFARPAKFSALRP